MSALRRSATRRQKFSNFWPETTRQSFAKSFKQRPTFFGGQTVKNLGLRPAERTNNAKCPREA
jgi:hypothetical protein